MKQNPQQLLDAAVGMRIPTDVNLYPRIAAQLEGKPLCKPCAPAL